jgi:hypothetical protein
MVAELGVPDRLTWGLAGPRSGQSRQPCNEIQRRMAAPNEHNLGGAIPVGRLLGYTIATQFLICIVLA